MCSNGVRECGKGTPWGTSAAEALKLANTDSRRAEATFQLGILVSVQDHNAARSHWQEIVDRSGPSQIEYAAARHELARPQSSSAL